MLDEWNEEVIKDMKEYGFDDTIDDCCLNFFLVDRKNGSYYYLLNIYGDRRDDFDSFWEYDFEGEFNPYDYSDFIEFVEEIAEHHNSVYLEIVDNDLVEKDGIGRFWCNVNERTYEMSYEEDWNTYVDYKREDW